MNEQRGLRPMNETAQSAPAPKYLQDPQVPQKPNFRERLEALEQQIELLHRLNSQLENQLSHFGLGREGNVAGSAAHAVESGNHDTRLHNAIIAFGQAVRHYEQLVILLEQYT